MTPAERPIPGQPRTSRLLRRGLARRCPACGTGGLFRRWVSMVDDCPRCGLHFERIEGHWIGAIGINTIASFGVLLLSLAVGVILTFPELPVATLIIVNVAVASSVPVVFYPFSRTLWTAVDLAMRPLEGHEVDWTQVR
ncbi:MAG: DUF983 domain-containing protein [Acidimicrobiales bacterium]